VILGASGASVLADFSNALFRWSRRATSGAIWEVVTLTSPSGGGELAFKDARLATPSDKLAEAMQ